MKKLLLTIAATLALCTGAFAQATFTAKDAAGSTQTFKSFNCTPICPLSVPADSTGAALGVAGNPFTVVDDTIVAQGTALGSVKNGLVGGSVTTSAPSYSTGQISPLSIDTIGGLRVTNPTITAQGTALGSTRTTLQGGSVTTAAPSYSTGQISPLSLSTVGNLRVDGSSVTQPVSGTVTATVASTSATGSAPPASASYVAGNGSGATGGLLAGLKTCDLHAKYDASTSGSTTLVTGVASRKVYICGFIMATGSTATNVKLREGSDANCATNAADLTPAYQLLANDKIGMQSPFWTGLAVSTNAYYVCINASAANAVQGELWYTIQ